ncbi:DUF6674 family protein [Thomasclavelia sp.]
MESQLLQHESMKRFLQLLDENDMSEQKENVEFLATYVDSMEYQLNEVLNELKNVKTELTAIQDKTLKATATRTVDKVTHKVEECKCSLLKLKQHIINTVDKAVSDFKIKGKSALSKGLETLKVKEILSTIKKGLDGMNQIADESIDNLSKLGDEVHAVNSHFKNIGRIFLGKEAKDISPRDTNKGLLLKVQEGLFFSMAVFTKMSMQTHSVMGTIDKIQQEPKQSVKNELKDIKDAKSSLLSNKTNTKENKQRGQR